MRICFFYIGVLFVNGTERSTYLVNGQDEFALTALRQSKGTDITIIILGWENQCRYRNSGGSVTLAALPHYSDKVFSFGVVTLT